jgi:predicted pyridoxine 5'-phosphate oxidase superfamily flavin-nucleotide-binding protein
MSKHYGAIAFTDSVRQAQAGHGSRAFYDRKRERGHALPGPDPLTAGERAFLSDRDGFYLATVSETGWPYVQYRGGPVGFLHVIDDHTVGWADFQGNLQYISTGNLAVDDRVAMIVMDYVNRRRLKIYGHARMIATGHEQDLIDALTDPTYDAVVEGAVVVTVDAFDWNCPQHITPRYTAAELEPRIASLRRQISELRAENGKLRDQLEEAVR